MKLIGMLDSPYVRRVAISAKRLDLPFVHRALSVFRNFDEFREINPLVKAPTLVCDDNEILMDSSLILDYLEELAGPGKSLMPLAGSTRRNALRLIGVGMIACEKAVQLCYETTLRPADKQHQPWIERVTGQMQRAYDLLEAAAAEASAWLVEDKLTQADITVAVAWRFTHYATPGVLDGSRYPALTAHSARAEALPEFISTPLD